TYDNVRGEPRGGRSRKVDHKEAGMGDCVDCSLCVQVCPTGIDIRNGLQYMCIGCGACVDACDQVMDKMDYPHGLIRYTSGTAIKERLTQGQARRRVLRPRILFYISLLVLIFAGFMYSLVARESLKVDVIRDRGALGREISGGLIENVYRLQIMNTNDKPVTLQVTVDGVTGATVGLAENPQVYQLWVDGSTNRMVPIVVRAPVDQVQPGVYDISISVSGLEIDGTQEHVIEKSSFFVPQ
ncbi:MAG: cytochrome c oxidase accessory protein CcoG, partial [Alcaligenaceae bacterium]|nr:cytochrome c oxidase accessory protein CcoG [Alcaligenaceae bacterium]